MIDTKKQQQKKVLQTVYDMYLVDHGDSTY